MRLWLCNFLLVVFFSSGLKAQNNDCVTAEVICSSGPVAFNPGRPGMNDFANPVNDNDCLLGNEHQSAWYYFQFQPTMPANSVITFTITPNAGPCQFLDCNTPSLTINGSGSQTGPGFHTGGKKSFPPIFNFFPNMNKLLLPKV